MNLTNQVQSQEYLNKQLNERLLTQKEVQPEESPTTNDVQKFYLFF